MTVSNTIAAKTYDGDGATVNFPTTFVFSTPADIEVIERVVATGVETTKALTTDYTVTGGGGAGADAATGTVVAVTAPASTVTWTIRRVVAETQTTALPNAGSLPSKSVELMSDRSAMMVQQHTEELGRSLSFPKTDSDTLDPTIPSSVDRASKFLAFDSSGNPIASTGPTGDSSIPVSSFMETVLDDATAAAARTTMGALGEASISDTNTGTSTTEAVTPDGLAGSNYGTAVVPIMVFDTTVEVATGDAAGGVLFRVPSTLNGFDLVGVAATVGTAGTTGTLDIQIHNVTDTADMLSTKLTIDSGETDSSTAATAAVIDTSNDDVATGDLIRIDVDAVQTTQPLGLFVELQFRLP